MRFVYAAAVAALLAGSHTDVQAGKFSRGILRKSDWVTLNIPRPPDAYPQMKSVGIEISEHDERFRDVTRLRLQIEQQIARDFDVDAADPDARLNIVVVAFDPPNVSFKTQQESRTVKVGNKAQLQMVPVQYWVGRGRISLRVELSDREGVPLDTFDPEYVFDETRENLVNGQPPVQQAANTTWWKPVRRNTAGGTSDEVGLARVETPDDIASLIYEEVSFLIKRRYVKTVDPVRFKLAVDDELRPGNELVMTEPPDWEAALASWEASTMKKPEFEGDRQYNMAVAHEALAYQAYEATLNPDDAMPWFEKALALYERASSLDSEEKWIVNVADRLRLAKENIGRAVDQRNTWAAEREQLRLAFIAKREGQKQITAARPDTPEEASFRTMVRAQGDAGSGMDEAQLTALGTTLGLTDISIQRVLLQENERRERLGTYENLLTPLIADGALSSQERQALDAMKPGLRITDEEAAAIEARHEFTVE